MRTYRFPICFCFIVAFCSACNDPLVMIPGARLAGETAPAPAVWDNVPDTIQLETRPADPYSINIWGVGIGESLYVATGADGTNWSEFIAQDSRVRVRIGTTIYALNAVLVDAADERAKVAAAYVEKYDIDLDDNWLESGIIFRLEK